MNDRFVDRPRLISERLAENFADADPQAKQLWTLVIQLSEMLRGRADELIKSLDLQLTRGEIMVITCLRLSDFPYELRQHEISDRVLMTTGGVTNICRQLEKREWIQRSKAADDARVTLYRLTDSGLEVANTVIPTIHDAEKRIASHMDRDEISALCTLLERVTQHV